MDLGPLAKRVGSLAEDAIVEDRGEFGTGRAVVGAGGRAKVTRVVLVQPGLGGNHRQHAWEDNCIWRAGVGALVGS